MKERVIPLLFTLSVALSVPALADPAGPRAAFEPVFGVRVAELEARELDARKIEYGVRVMRVTPGTAAEAAGLREGDVLLELAGRPVYSAARLRHLVAGLRESEKFSVVYLRGERRTTAETQLQAAPPAARAPAPVLPPHFFPGAWFLPPPRLGVQLQELTDELRAVFGVDRGAGVLVAEVLPDSPARKAGVTAGDVIVRVDRRTVRGVADVHRALTCFEPGEEVALTVIRAKQALTLSVRLEGDPENARPPATRPDGREWLEYLERGLRQMFEGLREPAETLPGPGV